MSLPAWHEAPVARSQRRREFDCGDAAMNDYLHRYARQSHDQGAAKTFCAVETADPNRILGFYSIAPLSVARDAVPDTLTAGLARHDVPGYRLARLATDVSVAGQGLVGQLLVAAALRCLRVAVEAGGVLLVIDAKHERAARWYASFGAVALNDRPLTLVMPLATFASDLKARGLL